MLFEFTRISRGIHIETEMHPDCCDHRADLSVRTWNREVRRGRCALFAGRIFLVRVLGREVKSLRLNYFCWIVEKMLQTLISDDDVCIKIHGLQSLSYFIHGLDPNSCGKMRLWAFIKSLSLIIQPVEKVRSRWSPRSLWPPNTIYLWLILQAWLSPVGWLLRRKTSATSTPLKEI